MEADGKQFSFHVTELLDETLRDQLMREQLSTPALAILGIQIVCDVPNVTVIS